MKGRMRKKNPVCSRAIFRTSVQCIKYPKNGVETKTELTTRRNVVFNEWLTEIQINDFRVTWAIFGRKQSRITFAITFWLSTPLFVVTVHLLVSTPFGYNSRRTLFEYFCHHRYLYALSNVHSGKFSNNCSLLLCEWQSKRHIAIRYIRSADVCLHVSTYCLEFQPYMIW